MKTVAKARLLVTRFPYEARLGGEEMHTLRLMRELDKRGHEAFFMGSCPVLGREFERRGFEVRRVWLGKPPVTRRGLVGFTLLSPLLFGLAGWHLWRARRRWQVDTLYALSFGEKLLMTPWARLFGMRVLWLEHARIGRWLTQNPWRFVYRWWSRWARIVVTSNAMRPQLEGLGREVQAISCGVIVDTPEALPVDLQNFLNSGFAVATVARLTVDKGVDKVVRLVHSKPDVRLLVVGDGPLREVVEAAPKERVRWVPSLPRPQLMSVYKNVDVFVLASMEMDPFGMVAAEAMWFGTPVLLTDRCGIAADLKAGQDAEIVEAKFSALDKAFKKLRKHRELREALGRHGEAFVKRHYRFDGMVQAFEKLLTK